MNLSKLLAYDTKIDGRNLIIHACSRATGTHGHAVPRASPRPSVDTRHSLPRCELPARPNGEGRIIVDLSE